VPEGEKKRKGREETGLHGEMSERRLKGGKKRKERGRKWFAARGRRGKGWKRERRGRGCGPTVGPHPQKLLVTWHWHMCHVTICLIKKIFKKSLIYI
jgi:hypothetical protein